MKETIEKMNKTKKWFFEKKPLARLIKKKKLLLLLLLSRFSRVQLCATPWTAAHQAPPSLGFSRQEHWSGLSFPSPRDPSNQGIKLGSSALHSNTLTT